jgi:hypothetical protein
MADFCYLMENNCLEEGTTDVVLEALAVKCYMLGCFYKSDRKKNAGLFASEVVGSCHLASYINCLPSLREPANAEWVCGVEPEEINQDPI